MKKTQKQLDVKTVTPSNESPRDTSIDTVTLAVMLKSVAVKDVQLSMQTKFANVKGRLAASQFPALYTVGVGDVESIQLFDNHVDVSFASGQKLGISLACCTVWTYVS